MVENYEDKNQQNELTKRKVDDLDRDINNLDNKVQEREDFTKYIQDLQDIYDKFNTLESDINNISNENLKKDLENRMNSLRKNMLDFISDGNIDNLINGKTKDTVINGMVGQVDEIFWNEMTNLIANLQLGNGEISDILSDTSPMTESRLTEIAQFLGVPYGKLQVEGQEYFGFMIPRAGDSGELYALVDGKLKICEGTLDNQNGGADLKTSRTGKQEQGNNNRSISSSEKLTKASADNLLLKKETAKVSYNAGNGFSGFASLETQGIGATPRVGFNWKGFNKKIEDVGINTQLIASYSPGSISGDVSGGWKDKDVFKGKFTENLKFKKGVSLSISEIFKTSDFSKIGLSNLSTEVKASYKPHFNKNMDFSGIVNLNNKGISFIGGGLKWIF